jgi:hypothetical protein
VPLLELTCRIDAEAFQAAAVKALGGTPCGYKIGAWAWGAVSGLAGPSRLLNYGVPH